MKKMVYPPVATMSYPAPDAASMYQGEIWLCKLKFIKDESGNHNNKF